MTRYTIVINDAGASFAASVIELGGVITTGKTIDEVDEKMRAAISFHLYRMRNNSDELLESTPIVEAVHVVSRT